MIVEFKDVVKEYGSKEAVFKAVDNVSFGIEEGGVCRDSRSVRSGKIDCT